MVVSDHGMTKSGGHGGNSFEELNTPFFAYSKTKFNKNNDFNLFDPKFEKSVD